MATHLESIKKIVSGTDQHLNAARIAFDRLCILCRNWVLQPIDSGYAISNRILEGEAGVRPVLQDLQKQAKEAQDLRMLGTHQGLKLRR
jgi:hypothetical protein